jgi:1-deoxy-D-xylulose-5-phosphate reductoisomerase
MGKAQKKIAIIGSTGSIGQQALDIVRTLPHQFQVVGLAAGQNMKLLARQVDEFKPAFAHFQGKETATHLSNTRCEFLSPDDIACHPQVDTVVIAASGRAGLSPTLVAVKAGKKVALANKESLVMAGEIITREAKESGAQILPIDSEHSAIWQCLRGETQPPIQIILTASGGPFRHHSPKELENVTVKETLKHPTWLMGKKVTIDSATLMNKGLEVIEAHWLFDVPVDRMRVLIHPQSIIHSMVEFIDGSTKAQLSYPDMRLPIQYALSYPERLANTELPTLDWDKIKELSFELPDFDAFPCLRLAIEAGRKGGTCPAVLAAADEVMVELFLSQRIRLTDIARIVEQTLTEHEPITHPTLEEIIMTDSWARERARQLANGDNLCGSPY